MVRFKGYLGRKADKMQLILVCNTLGSGGGGCSAEMDLGAKVASVYVVVLSGLFFSLRH